MPDYNYILTNYNYTQYLLDVLALYICNSGRLLLVQLLAGYAMGSGDDYQGRDGKPFLPWTTDGISDLA